MILNRRYVVGAFAALALSQAAWSASALTEADVKTAVQKARPAMHLVWKSVQIAGPRRASAGESGHAGMPYPVTIYLARVAFVEQVPGGSQRDVTWNYYIYKDDFGSWVAASNAIPGNLEGRFH